MIQSQKHLAAQVEYVEYVNEDDVSRHLAMSASAVKMMGRLHYELGVVVDGEACDVHVIHQTKMGKNQRGRKRIAMTVRVVV